MTSSIPSPELKAVLKQWVALQKERYGEDWAAILAKEMTANIPNDFKRFVVDRLNAPTIAVPTEEKKS